MAEKSLTIILRAKNAMAAGLGSAQESLQAFGKSAMQIGAFFIKGFLAAGAAVAGFAVKAIQAYSEQEKAGRAFAAALNAQGEAGDALLPLFSRIASAIQDETGANDESTLAGMAKMRMLGVQTSKLGEAARATIALKSIGLEEAAAQKAVALAMQGNYAMLNRYVPALRTATSEQEKATIVADLFARGYEQQKEVLNTVSGQWGLLKGRVGDLMEEIGAAIAQNDSLMDALKRAGEAVKDFGAAVAAWVEGGGIVQLIAGVRLFYADVTRKFQLISNTVNVTWSAIADGAETAFNYLKNVIDAWSLATYENFKYIGDYAVAIWKKIKSPMSKFEPPDMGPMKQAVVDYAKAIAGSSGIVTRRTEAALDDRLKIEEEYAAKVVEIAEEQAAAQIALEEKVAKKKKDAAEAEKKLAEETAEVVEKELKKNYSKIIENLKAELSAIQKNKRAVEDLAQTRVQKLIEDRQAEKDLEKELSKEEKKAARLTAREGTRGVTLSKKDSKWLSAYRAIKDAKGQAGKLTRAEHDVETMIETAQETLKVEQEMRDALDNIQTKMDDVLTY